MKIIAQSTVAPKLPYLHIAYLAATTMKHSSHTITIASLFMVAGVILLLFRLPLKKLKSLSKENSKLRKYKTISFLGFFCVIASVILFFFGNLIFGEKGYTHPKVLTKSKMIRATNDYILEKYEKKVKSLEEYMKKNKEKFMDAWNNQMKVEKATINGKDFLIISSGEDRKFDTDDDFNISFEDIDFNNQPADSNRKNSQ